MGQFGVDCSSAHTKSKWRSSSRKKSMLELPARDGVEEVGHHHQDIDDSQHEDESKGLLGASSADDSSSEGMIHRDFSYLKLLASILLTIPLLFLVGRRGIGLTRNDNDDDAIIISPLKDIKQVQVENYINGNALLLNIHITHHAGTAICKVMKDFGPVPQFACMGNKGDGPWPEGLPANKGSFYYGC